MIKIIHTLFTICFLSPIITNAQTVAWVDWNNAQNGKPGIALGEIKLGDQTITVQYTGEILFAQTSGGINYWQPSDPYISKTVENAPPNEDIVTLTGGNALINTLTFSQPVNNPVMAIISLGQDNSTIDYVFQSSFIILSAGTGYFGGDASALSKSFQNTLKGKQGHGVIQFPGSVTTISWTAPKFDNWHGFTIGIPGASDDCSDTIGTLSPDLDIFIPSINFQGKDSETNYWGELEYMGTDLNGNVLWRLKNYGVNQ